MMAPHRLFRQLDHIPIRDLWPEISERAAEGPSARFVRGEVRQPMLRSVALATAVVVGFAVVLVGVSRWITSSGQEGTGRPGGRPDTAVEDPMPPAVPEMVPIEGGFRLYQGEWLGEEWELVALERERPNQGCSGPRYIVAYRDAHGRDALYEEGPSVK